MIKKASITAKIYPGRPGSRLSKSSCEMIEKFIFIRGSFLKNHSLRLTWTQMLWGLDKGLIRPMEISIYALQIMEDDHTDNPDIILLAGVRKDALFQVRELVERLSAREERQEKEFIEEKWLYIVLLWLYEHRDTIDDPLGKVEIVYSDFNYPASVSSFVRYMPSEKDSRSSRPGLSFLYDQWNEFLEHRC